MAKVVLAGFQFNGMRTVTIQRYPGILELAQNKKNVDAGFDQRVAIMSNSSLNPELQQGIAASRQRVVARLARRSTDVWLLS
jgi:hypothetical protein